VKRRLSSSERKLAVGLAVVGLAMLGLVVTVLIGGAGSVAPTTDPTATTAATTASPTPATAPTASASASATATPHPSPSPSVPPSLTPTPSLYAPLDGLPAFAELAGRLPIAVMIDNDRRARPQAGFSRASIVYQSPNDGGTNRYLLVFHERDAELVGPVRSTRLFYNAWAFEYRPAFAHFGGDWRSVKQLDSVDGELAYDVDALAGAGAAFWRDRTKRAPFNAYTDTERLRAAAERRGAPAGIVDGLVHRPFAADVPPEARPSSGSIVVPYRGYRVSYTYDHATNSYLRSVGDEPQHDALDGTRVTARNVIVQFVDVYYDASQRYNRAVMDFVGSGDALVFRDGLAIAATWEKSSEEDLTRFVDGAGNEVTLVRGPIFVQVVAKGTDVEYVVGDLPSPGLGSARESGARRLADRRGVVFLHLGSE